MGDLPILSSYKTFLPSGLLPQKRKKKEKKEKKEKKKKNNYIRKRKGKKERKEKTRSDTWAPQSRLVGRGQLCKIKIKPRN